MLQLLLLQTLKCRDPSHFVAEKKYEIIEGKGAKDSREGRKEEDIERGGIATG